MEQNQALTDMMKQLLDGFNDLKAKQIETREAIDEIRARTEAVEARAAGIGERTAPTPPTPPSPTDPGTSTHTPRAMESSSPPFVGPGSHDHRAATLHRGDAPGILGIPLPAPGTGAIQSRPASADFYRTRHEEFRDESVRAPAPKIEFPKFDGENPKLWQQQCETYFEVFRVQPCLRTRYAVLGFQGNAALWFQGVEAQEIGRAHV